MSRALVLAVVWAFMAIPFFIIGDNSELSTIVICMNVWIAADYLERKK